MSQGNLSVVVAFERGYRVSDAGEILNPSGAQLKGSTDSRGYRTFSLRPPKGISPLSREMATKALGGRSGSPETLTEFQSPSAS